PSAKRGPPLAPSGSGISGAAGGSAGLSAARASPISGSTDTAGSAGSTRPASAPRAPQKLVAMPATTAVTNAASGRNTVMIGSMRAQLSAIESTPISGVEMRKDTVAPRVAPCRESPMAVGGTPQEQKGSGVPIAEAQRTDLIRPRPR